MSLTHNERIQGTQQQQQPHVTKMAIKVATEIRRDIITFFHFPNMFVIHSSIGLLIPDCSCMVLDRVRRPSKALVTEPSGAVLLGIKP